ncbi:hypothetical protein [Hyalangium minutum]|uniref:DUF4785 domain-containing protein n=1 Tax=Hyalangium minutum TaxID=394096 RepID=A0A085WKU1_9BACT|nr:hypothetical protein [Hyalangium minutum]KFE68304.1 hypothetical protein DB31_7541 [Hyalangium minutum]
MAEEEKKQRGLGAAAAMVAVVAVLGALMWPRSPKPVSPPGDAAGAPVPEVAQAPRPPPPPVSQPAASLDPLPPGTTLATPPEAPPLELPPTTQVLTEELFPGTTDWESIPVDDAHQLRIQPLRYNVVTPMPIAVLLEMIDAQGQRQPLPSPRVRVRSQANAAQPWIQVPVKDDGTGSDAKAGDLQYTATLQPTAEQQKLLLGQVLIEGSVEGPGKGTQVIPSMLVYSRGPRAKLTDQWRDFIRQGHLDLEAEVEVEEAGKFTLMAQIFGPNQQPIAWVRQTDELLAGRGHITLEVFGKVLHDAGIDGPYRVRQVLLTRNDENSSQYDPGVPIEEAHQTKAYRASEFSAEPYQPALPPAGTPPSPGPQDLEH